MKSNSVRRPSIRSHQARGMRKRKQGYHLVQVASTGGPDADSGFFLCSIRIDGTTYEHDVVIEGGEICKRKKGPSTCSLWRGDSVISA
jgi:hypothetical protein